MAGLGKDKLVQNMFEDYLQTGENWMQSTMYVNLTQSNTLKRRGKHRMVAFKDLKSKFGVPLAASILKEKQVQEQQKPKNDPTVYYMPHPDAPDSEDSYLYNLITVCFFAPKIWFIIFIASYLQVPQRRQNLFIPW